MKKIMVSWFLACFVLLTVLPVMADKTSVEIDAPGTAEKGEVITIVVRVRHSGNNLFHHTNWVYLRINGEQVARWEYSWKDLPEKEIFVKEVTYPVQGSITIEAKANCNIHGSEGTVTKQVEVE